jgi:mannosyltransferase
VLPAGVLTGTVVTALGLVGAGRPTTWTDEAVTRSMVRRPVGQALDVLREADAVHGLYYLVLRGWTLVAGDSIGALRTFSALGIGVAAAGVVLLVARYRPVPVAVVAGLATGLLPGLAWASVEARGYAWAAALAVLATLALDVAVERGTRRAWMTYGGVALLACWWHLYLVLLLLAHGVAVAGGRSDVRRPWVRTAAGVGAGVAPLAWIAWHQREQVAWLADLHYTWASFVEKQLGGSYPGDPVDLRLALAVALVGLGALGCLGLVRTDGPWPALLLAGWAGLPIVVGLVAAVTDAGVLHTRYLTFAGPAVAILATLGAASLPRLAPALVAVAALVAVVPLLVAQRAEDARPHDVGAVAAAVVQARADAVLFTSPPARSVAYAYPDAFAGTVDLSAVADPAADPFFDETRDSATLTASDVTGHRIVVVGTREVPDASHLRELGCHPRHLHRDRGYQVWLYRCSRVSPAGR